MKKIATVTLAALTGALALNAAEPAVKAPITRAALFKNGYALVTRTIAEPPPGPFLVDEEKFVPVHGTLWFTPGDGLDVSAVKRTVQLPNENPFSNLSASYEGAMVTVVLKSAGPAPQSFSGQVVRLKEAQDNSQFLTLSTREAKLVAIPVDQIQSIEASSINSQIRQEAKRLLINRKARIAGPLSVTYLTYGLTWAPAYRVALGPDSKMQLDQSATIVNDLEDLKHTDVQLVSGFPNLQYKNVTSPLAPQMTLDQFLRQLYGQDERPMPMYKSRAFAVNAEFAAGMAADEAVSPLPESGLSEDIQLTPAGAVTLASGDTLYTTLASAETTYERLVEWNIPDGRNPWGIFVERNPEAANGTLWDAVRFKNPLKSAISTAPVEIVDGGKLLGQTTFKWVNPGESTLLQITKAQTVTGAKNEYEVPNRTEPVNIAGVNYRSAQIQGTLKLHNYRASDAKVAVKLAFSGKLVSADGKPAEKLLESGIYSVNPRSELSWDITLKPAEELELKYTYSVLIRN